MDPVLPHVVVMPEEEAAPCPTPISLSNPPIAWQPEQDQFHPVEVPGVDQGGGGGRGATLAKLVQTVRFIKRWTARTEQEPDQREQFLGRFKMAAPNIDDAFTQNEGEGGTATQGREVRKQAKIYCFHPSGSLLFCWLLVITVVVLYNLFMIIVRETFDQLQSSLLSLWLTLDYLADTVYLLDMVVQFRTSE